MANTQEICLKSPIVQAGVNNTAAQSPSNHVFKEVYVSITIILDILFWITFALLKHRFARTRLRSTFLVGMAVLGAFCALTYPIQILVGNAYPCWLTVVVPVLIIPLVGGSVMGNLISLQFLSRFSETSAMAMSFRSSEGVLVSEDMPRLSTFKTIRKVFALLLTASRLEQTGYEIQENLVYLKFLTSKKGIMVIFSVFLLPFLALGLGLLASDPVLTTCYNCSRTPALIFTMVAMSIIVLILGMTLSWRTRHLPDTWGFGREALYSLLFCLIALIGLLLTVFTEVREDETYSQFFLVMVGLTLMIAEQTVVQLYVAWRQNHKFANQIEPRGGEGPKSTAIDEILRDKSREKSFEAHLAAEFGLENLYFIRDVEIWKGAFHDVAPTARRARAKLIQKTFLNDDSVFTINISWVMRQSITRILDDADSVLSVTLFDEAETEIKWVLNNGSVLRFNENRIATRNINQTAVTSSTTV